MSELRIQAPPQMPRRFEAQPVRGGALRVVLGVQEAAQEVRTPDATLDAYPAPRRHLSEAELFAAYGVREETR